MKRRGPHPRTHLMCAALVGACVAALTWGAPAGAVTPPTPVPLMPGTTGTFQAVITADGIYTQANQNGNVVYRRSLTSGPSGTTLGPATLVAHGATDGAIAADGGTVAYARPVDDRLVLDHADGTETVAAWDDDMAFVRGMGEYTGTWINADTLGAMNHRLLQVATGAEVDLLAITPAAPAGIATTRLIDLTHTDTRAVWAVFGRNDSTSTEYVGVFATALDATGPTGPVMALDTATCDAPCAWPYLIGVHGDLVVWRTEVTATTATYRWYSDSTHELTAPAHWAVLTGTELVALEQESGATTLTWYDLASASPDVPVRTAAVPGSVLAVHGTLVAYRTASGPAQLVDVSGLPITADPDPVVTPAFSDVPGGVDYAWTHPTGFPAEIQWLADHGIVGGYPDGTFRPTALVTRAAMAAFLYRTVHGDAATPACATAPFSDVPASHPFCGEIAWLDSTGVATGWPDGTFRPTAPVTRQAMAAFLYRLAEGPGDAPACPSAPFSDVSAADPFCGEIAWLATTGVTTGWPDGSFHPIASITRQAMAAFLFRFIDAGLVPAPE